MTDHFISNYIIVIIIIITIIIYWFFFINFNYDINQWVQ